MKKIIILVIAVCVICGGVFSVPVSSASIFQSGKETEVRNFIFNYYDKSREKDAKYLVSHIAKFQDMIARARRENPRKNWGKLDEELFVYIEDRVKKDPEAVWGDWDRLLDGTRVSVDEIRHINKEEASEMGIENRDEVYQVFVRFHFTKRSSSRFDEKDAVLLKEFVLQVFVYYDYGKMLVDTERIIDVPLEHQSWDNDV